MKKLLFILSFLLCFVTAFSQLPTVVEVGQDTFRIKRGNLVLRSPSSNIVGYLGQKQPGGVTEFIRFEKLSDTSFIWDTDTMYASNVSVIGGSNDTIVNVGLGSPIYKGKNGSQFEMKTLVSDGSIVFADFDDSLRLVVDSALFATVFALSDTAANIRASMQALTASRGIHINGGDIRWGESPLDSAVTIDQVGNGITFHNGSLIHGLGDFNDQLTAYNRLENSSGFFSSNLWDGANAATSLFSTIGGGLGQIGLQATDGSGNTSQFYVGSTVSNISMFPYSGNLFVHNLRDSAQDYQVYYDPATGLFTYGASAGGPSGTDSVYTVNSGLSASTPTNFQLGAVNNTAFPLLHTSWINTDTYTLNVRGASATWPFQVENTSTGYAGRFASIDAAAIQAVRIPASTNSVVSVLDLIRSSTGTAANGIGAGIDYYVQSSLGGSSYAGTTAMVWSDVNFPSRTSRYDISTVNNTVTSRKLSVAGSGKLTLDKYGVGAFPGTPVWSLGVLANGDVIEYTPSSGGTTTAVTANNGLIANTPTNIQLGTNPLIQNTTIPTSTFSLSLTGAFSGNLFNVTNTNTTGAAINAVGGTGAAGVQASGGLYGVYGQTTAGTAIRGISTSGLAGDFNGSALSARFTSNPTSTNTVQDVVQFIRTSTGTAANGIGGAATFLVKDAGGLFQTSHQLISKWTDVTNLTRTSQFELYNVNNATFARALAITGPGQMILDKYGIGTFTGTLAKVLGTTSTGAVVEIDPGDLGAVGSTVTADRGLHTSSSTNVRWGGSLDSAVAVNQSTNEIKFHDGYFRHIFGDPDDFSGATDWSAFNDNDLFGFWGKLKNGDFSQLHMRADSTNDNTFLEMKIGDFQDPTAETFIGLYRESGGYIDINPGAGGLFFSNIPDSAQSYNIQYDPSERKITYSSGLPSGSVTNFGGAHEIGVVSAGTVQLKTLVAGAGVTITETDSTITVSASAVGSETNTLAFNLTTTGNRTIAADNIVQYILVKPTSTLAGLKIGTVSDDDFYLTATPVTGGAWVAFNLGEYLAAGTTFYFSGITSSTDIKIVYKPLHE